MNRTNILLSALYLAAAACTASEQPSEAHHAIIDGALAPSDTAVIAVGIYGGPGEGSLCSGTIVSPHVVLTAAHCVDQTALKLKNGEGDYTHAIYLGTNIFDADENKDWMSWNEVTKIHIDPGYDANDTLSGPNDIALIAIKRAAKTSIPLIRRTLDSSDEGKEVRVLGYGLTNSALDSATGGARHQRLSRIDTITATQIIRMPADGAVTCGGDSGGPSLLREDGIERIIGVHSSAKQDDGHCSPPEKDVRVDAKLSFIESIIRQTDPGFLSAEEPTPKPDLAPTDAAEAAPNDEGCNAAGPPTTTTLLLFVTALALRSRSRRSRA